MVTTAAPPGPVRLRRAAYDTLKSLADGETVKDIQPQLRSWLRDRRYITWTKTERDRHFRLTDLGRSVISTAIRGPQ